jgi:hypothetical protein
LAKPFPDVAADFHLEEIAGHRSIGTVACIIARDAQIGGLSAEARSIPTDRYRRRDVRR